MFGQDRSLRVRTSYRRKYGQCNTVQYTKYCQCVYPLLTLNRSRGVHVTKDIDLSHSRDPMHNTRPFTNATRSVNKNDVGGMVRSEIILFITTRARIPWTLLTQQQSSNPVIMAGKGFENNPMRSFSGWLWLWTLGRNWRSNALAGAKRRLVAYM